MDITPPDQLDSAPRLVRNGPATLARTRLCDEIEAAIHHFLEAEEKPPLSVEELIVMSLVFVTGATRADILKWFITSFRYYREAALNHFCRRPGSTEAAHAVESLQWSMSNHLRRFNIPVTKTRDDHDELYHTDDTPARSFLQSVFHLKYTSATSKGFPFMRLPAELRVQIYEMVLGFPPSGVAVRPDYPGGDHKLAVLSRSYDELCQPTKWVDTNLWNMLSAPTPYEFLALLRVSKTVYKEAKPVFFNINTFVCLTSANLYSFLQRIGEDSRKQIRHLVFKYGPSNRPVDPYSLNYTRAAKLLTDMPKLQQLDICCNEAEWTRETKGNTTTPLYPNLLKLPGLTSLRTIRGLKRVNFHGTCDTIRNHLADEMVKPRAASGKRKSGGKRKATSDGKKGAGGRKARKAT